METGEPHNLEEREIAGKDTEQSYPQPPQQDSGGNKTFDTTNEGDEPQQAQEPTRAELARMRQREGGSRGGKIGSAKRWAKPGAREAQREHAKRYLTPEVRHKLTPQDRAKRWEDPQTRIANSQHMQRYWARRREEKKQQSSEEDTSNDTE